MSRTPAPIRRYLAPGGLLAGLALTGSALALGAFPSHPAAAEQTVAHAVSAPSPLALPAPARRASRGTARVALRPVRVVTREVAVGRTFSGAASWYGGSFQGRRTANGERFDTHELTAASRTLPFGTRLRVCRHGRCVVVRVNDRGPYVSSRVLDLSQAARDRLGFSGVARVTATPVATRRVRVHPPVRRRPVAVVRPARVVVPAPSLRPASYDGSQGGRSGADALLAGGAMLAAASGLTWVRRLRASAS